MNNEESQNEALKKRKRTSEAKQGPTNKSNDARPSYRKAYKSAEFVHDSDLSDVEPAPSTSKPAVATNVETTEVVTKPTSPPPPRPKVAPRSSDTSAQPRKSTSRKQYKSAEIVESDSDVDGPRTASSSKNPEPEEPSAEAPVENEEVHESEPEPESEVEAPPKKRGRGKGKTVKEKAAAKPKRAKKVVPELSKDEETLKRLKSFVTACGVRKMWSKEFQGLDTPQQQIKRLRAILTSLGMTGRMSLEQAKAIKEKRELAKELEDVQKFGDAVSTGRPFRTQRTAHAEQPGGAEEEGEESDVPAAVPPKAKRNARQSIMAFLETQSEEE
ncbi:hypothetical protein FA95DRAFT_1600044 [Auriscalpium vulgare]|uniref:Uncharacterized protein n=1 Tax=Auriscalpium vulgare TaxID=40419 RepID=A0ACB8R3K6_9AGAM|nr:hypothetical protein FA95DRAFT_1600044 [Auriscalpium vulgare]